MEEQIDFSYEERDVWRIYFTVSFPLMYTRVYVKYPTVLPYPVLLQRMVKHKSILVTQKFFNLFVWDQSDT